MSRRPISNRDSKVHQISKKFSQQQMTFSCLFDTTENVIFFNSVIHVLYPIPELQKFIQKKMGTVLVCWLFKTFFQRQVFRIKLSKHQVFNQRQSVLITNLTSNPLDTGRKLKVHQTFRRRHVLYTCNLRPVSRAKMMLTNI